MSEFHEPDDRERESFRLAMPFVSVRSVGGAFDDDSYVAGYECGCIDVELRSKPLTYKRILHTGNLPQLDLIAMKHGYVCHHRPSRGADGWSKVLFIQSRAERQRSQ